MSVTSFNEVFAGRGGRITGMWQRNYRRAWVAQTDDANDDAAVILAYAGCPRLYDVYATSNAFDPSAFCKSVTPEQDANSPTIWRVTADYDTIADPRKQDANPLNRPSVITWDFSLGSKILEKATFINGTTGAETENSAVCNSAGEPFETPPEVDDTRVVLQIQKSLPEFNTDLAFEYTNAINNDPWLGGDPYTWKCQGISGRLEYAVLDEGAIPFWDVQATFEYRREGWRLELLDAGYHKKNGGGTNLIVIKDENEQPLTKPRLLDGSGGVLALSGTPVYRKYKAYRELPFGGLAIP
jgi:hypothetical protein